MRALLIAAALAFPIAANANDDAKVNKDQVKDTAQIGSRSNTDQQPFSQAKVVNKIHHADNMNIQLGQLAQTRAGTDKIRSFGKKLVSDHQKLDQQVLSYAKDNGITLDQYGKSGSSGTDLGSGQQNDKGSSSSIGAGSGSVGSSGNSAAMGGKDDQSGSGAVASGDVNDQGNPGGSSAVNRNGSEMGTTTPNSYGGVAKSGPGSAYEKSGSTGRAADGRAGSTYGSTNNGAVGSGMASAGQTGTEFSGIGNGRDNAKGLNNGVGSNSGIDNNGNAASTRGGTVVGTNDSTNSKNSGPGADSNIGSASSGSSVDSSGMSMRGDLSQKLDALRNLQGAEFDAQFLSNVIDGSQRAIDRLQGWRGQGDKKLDSLIDKSVKVLQGDVKDAQKLQQRVPAA